MSKRRWWGGTHWPLVKRSGKTLFSGAPSGKVLSGLSSAPRRVSSVHVSNSSRIDALVGGLEAYYAYAFKKSKKLFHDRFDSSSDVYDSNGNDLVEVYYWVFRCLADAYPYDPIFAGIIPRYCGLTHVDPNFNASIAIPKVPALMSRLSYDFVVKPNLLWVGWPLNHFPVLFRDDSFGGGYTGGGRKVFLHSLKFGGSITGTNGEASIAAAREDTVRIMIVFDLMPQKQSYTNSDVDPLQVQGYVDPCDRLFVPIPSIAGASVGVNAPFSPQAQSRFRVLYDEKFHWKADPVLKNVQNIDSGITFTSVINPDDVNTKIFDVSTSEVGSTAAGSGVIQTAAIGSEQSVTGSGILASTTETVWPSPTLLIPCVTDAKLKAYDKVLQFSMTKKPLPDPDPAPDVVVFNNDGAINPAAPVSDFQHEFIQPDTIHFDGVIDLAKYGYFTVFDSQGFIESGAIFVIAVSDTGNTCFGSGTDILEYGGFCATTYYIDE